MKPCEAVAGVYVEPEECQEIISLLQSGKGEADIDEDILYELGQYKRDGTWPDGFILKNGAVHYIDSLLQELAHDDSVEHRAVDNFWALSFSRRPEHQHLQLAQKLMSMYSLSEEITARTGQRKSPGY